MRLNVFLSHNGIWSRRAAFDLVKAGRVLVNGVVVIEPSTEVDRLTDKILVDGKTVTDEKYVYLMLNKSSGYVTTKSDPYAEKIVTDLLPKEFHNLQPVGRLDKDTEGLLLFTNDGQIAQKLLHPSFEKEKTYWMLVEGRLAISQKQKLERGVDLGGEITAPAQVKIVKSDNHRTECLITIHEGRKRQIRRMMSTVNHPVLALKRLTFGTLELGNLKVGEYRLLTQEEILQLRNL